MDKRADNGDFLLHAVRALRDEVRQRVFNIQPLGKRFHARLAVRFRYAVHIRNKIQILVARQEFIKIRIIGYVGHDFFAGDGVFLNVDAVHRNGTAVRL